MNSVEILSAGGGANLEPFLASAISSLKLEKICEFITLTISQETLSFINNNIDLIYSWITSLEFEVKYKNTKFPPLMKPSVIDYKQLPANIAWELNIPLPKCRFIYATGHGSGGTAMLDFLRVLYDDNGKFVNVSYSESLAKDKYIYHYKNLLENANKTNAIAILDYGLSKYGSRLDRDKFFALLPRDVPLIMQVRDPISLIKTTFHKSGGVGTRATLNLNSDFNALSPYISWNGHKRELMPVYDSFKIQSFIYHSLLKSIASPCVYYVDFDDISKDRALDTMENIASAFSLHAPTKIENYKKVFRARFFRGALHNLWHTYPLTLIARARDIGLDSDLEVQLYISKPAAHFGGCLDIISLFACEFSDDICVYITEDSFGILKSNEVLYKATFDYVERLLSFLCDKSKEYDSHITLTIQDVLEYFRGNKGARENLKEILDYELAHIKKHREDIVNNWQYYLEFDRI